MTTTTYRQTILRSFAAMDIDGLRLYLKDEYTYEEATKDTFLDKLEAIFEKHRNSGDTKLQFYPGACAGETCPNCGNTGYRFVGNQSKKYIDLLFETEGDNITDIYCCSQFRSEVELPDLGSKSIIDVDLDEKANFPKSPSYWAKVYDAQDAYNEIITKPPRKLSFEEIEFWLNKYAELYKRLGAYKVLSPRMKWSPFFRFYYDFEEIRKAISGNMDKIIQANQEWKNIDSEDKLIDWAMSYEEVYHDGTFELKHFLEKKGVDYGFTQFNQYLFTGEVFAEACTFFNEYTPHHYELINKFSVYTSEEKDEITNQEDWNDKSNDRESLRFYLKKRKELEDLGLFLPYYLANNEKPDEKTPF